VAARRRARVRDGEELIRIDASMTPIAELLNATVTSVEVDALPEGISLGLSSPRPGSRGVLPFAFLLEGFLAAEADVVDHLEVRFGQRKLREVPVGPVVEMGDELAETGGKGLRVSRFSALVGTVRLPRSFKLNLRVVLASNERLHLCEIAGTRAALSLPAGTTPRLSPLMVTSLGRTGTTWLMRLLSEHPELVMNARYPFEARLQRYWVHWLQIMAEPANHRESSHPETFPTQHWSVGANPFFTAEVAKEDPALAQQLSGEHVIALAGFAHQATETYYLSCMTRFGHPNARFFVEKHVPDMTPRLVWELYPGAKEIILVRDPRDMLASILAFNEKRGSSGFGRDRVETDTDFVRQLASGVSGLMQNWRSRREQAHLLRYEDLLTAPEKTLRETFEYVGIDASADMVQRVLRQASAPDAALAFHMTSRDQGASIGRWKRDLRADVQALCSEEFGPALAEFGYEG